MQLLSADGASITVTLVGYQFPYDGPPTGGEDTDANWLMVNVAVRRADGQTHQVTDPCLLTDEAKELGDWLRAIPLGRVEPTNRPKEWNGGLLYFIEPNIAFSLSQWDADHATIRVHLSAECTPPWAKPRSRMYKNFLTLHIPNRALTLAANQWDRERAKYPMR